MGRKLYMGLFFVFFLLTNLSISLWTLSLSFCIILYVSPLPSSPPPKRVENEVLSLGVKLLFGPNYG